MRTAEVSPMVDIFKRCGWKLGDRRSGFLRTNRIDACGDLHFPGDRIGVALETVRTRP